MPRQQTLTAVAAVVVFGLCGALPFYRSDGPGHSLAHGDPRIVDSAGASSSSATTQPALRVAPDRSSVPAEPSPVVLVDRSAIRVGDRAVSGQVNSTVRTGVKGPQSDYPTRDIRGRVRREGKPPTVQPMDRYRRHTVVDGDSFENLAVDFLGTASRATEIFELNRDQKGCENPEYLPVGVELLIPRQ